MRYVIQTAISHGHIKQQITTVIHTLRRWRDITNAQRVKKGLHGMGGGHTIFIYLYKGSLYRTYNDLQ